MKISEMSQFMNLECIQSVYDDATVASAYTSDLLSDVMANAREHSVLITIQAHKNTIAVATLVEISAIIVCNNRPVPEDMVAAARTERICIYTTGDNQFTVSGRLYTALGAG